MEREINLIVVHCSATPPSMDIGAARIKQFHKRRGWSDIGYNFVIKRDGTVETGRDINKIPAHAKGYNKNSIGVCYVGGVDSEMNPEDNRTDKQKDSLHMLLSYLYFKYDIKDIIGHNEVSSKACPSFCVPSFLEEINFYNKK
jgi:hypothetical protein